METIKIKKNIETTGMEAMRKEFVGLLSEKQIEFDKTCIKQSKQDLGKGIILATLKGEPQASIFWLRSMTEEGKKYSLLSSKAASELDFSEYQTEEPAPAEPVTPAKKEKKQKKSKKEKEEVIPEDPITHPAPETEEAPQEQEVVETPASE